MNAAPTEEQYLGTAVTFSGIEKENNVVNTTPTVLKSEYLAGGFVGSEETLLVLSHRNIWEGDLSDAVIASMLRDPEIFKCISVIKNGVLGDGVQFSPAVNQPTAIKPPQDGEIEPPERRKERLLRDKQIQQFNLSKKYADYMTRAFDNLEIPLRDVLTDMLDALPYGNRVAEKVFEQKQDEDFGKPLYYLKRLKVKPRKSTIFVTDRFLNLIGFKVFFREKDENGNVVLKPRVIRKEKFAVLTFGAKDGDPRGTSCLDSVFQAWSYKVQLWPEYLRWLIYSAIPPIIGYTSDKTDSRKVLRDSEGNLITDKDGNPVYESDVGALLNALKQVRNASALALPNGAKVEAIHSSVSGDPFKGFRDVLNSEIEMGLIHQTLATSDSRFNTRAASQVHVSILDELVWKIKGVVIDMITGMVKHIMSISFPDYDPTLTPIVSMGDSSRRDFAGDVGAISQLHISGFIGESQKPGIDRIIGLPPRDIYSDREFERQKAMEKAELANPSPQPQPDTTPVEKQAPSAEEQK